MRRSVLLCALTHMNFACTRLCFMQVSSCPSYGLSRNSWVTWTWLLIKLFPTLGGSSTRVPLCGLWFLERVIFLPTENSSRCIESRKIQKPRAYTTSSLGVGDLSKWMTNIPATKGGRTSISSPWVNGSSILPRWLEVRECLGKPALLVVTQIIN